MDLRLAVMFISKNDREILNDKNLGIQPGRRPKEVDSSRIEDAIMTVVDLSSQSSCGRANTPAVEQ